MISHTHKEANQVVDRFAKFGFRLLDCNRVFHVVPNLEVILWELVSEK